MKVYVNALTAAELADACGVSSETAGAIVAFREKHGPLKTIDELKRAAGADAAAIDSKKDLFDFSVEN